MFKEQYGESFDYGKGREIRLQYAAREIEEKGLPVKPGLYALLEFLDHRGIPMAVATACDRERAQGYLEAAGIRNYFKAVVCGDEIGHAKPWPDIFIRAAERLGTECEHTVVFEDSPNGIEAACRAGCIPVMVPDLTVPDDNLRKKCYSVINSLCEAEALLRPAACAQSVQ